MLRVTSCIGSRFRLPPCRPAYQRIQDESRRYCVRPCHCSIDKALSSMVPRWLEQRLTATLPLPLRPLSAVVPRRCRSPKLLRALSEHLPTPMAAERADDAEQCPRRCRCCPAQRCARAHGQQQKGSGLVLRPEVSHQNGCTHRCQTLTVGTSCALGSLPVKVSRRRNHPYSLEMGIDSERIQGPALTETADATRN